MGIRMNMLLCVMCIMLILSLSTLVLNSRDQQGMYEMQHFRTPRNPPYKRL